MVLRFDYINFLKRTKDKQIIKVITGIRRCGKSTLLEMFQAYLLEEGVEQKQIQWLNFEDLAQEELNNYRKLYDYLNANLVPNKKNYIFLDEIQRVDGFEKTLDSLFIKDNVDLYVTGSNAYMLSGELATFLSGRYIEVHMLPLSFWEYYSYVGGDKVVAFGHYLERGGFPFAIQLSDETTYRGYIEGIIHSVLIKDVLSRKQRSDAVLVEQLAKFLTDTAGNQISVKKIADTLTSMGQKTTSETVAGYLMAFQEAFLFYRCDRYDIVGKRYLSIHSKYYPADQSLRRGLLGTKRPNFGNRLESIVFLELIRRGYEVYIGTIGDLEIDFVAIQGGITEYYQVSLTVQEEKTFEREVAGLKKIKDNYRKILLTQDMGSYNEDGIEQMNVIDWLLRVKGF
ncbi:MAG: ATP-binding protein [Lachnospiraceae bacterium]|nr:ATP-binding protein [Lachnospiraceae bacterium]